MEKTFRSIFKHNKFFVRKIIRVIVSPIFLTISMFGNLVVLVSSSLFYYLESPVNPLVETFMDAVWWAFATITTVGYGDINPITFEGRILGILLMLLGTALFATYTALFANAILGNRLVKLDWLTEELKHVSEYEELKNKELQNKVREAKAAIKYLEDTLKKLDQ